MPGLATGSNLALLPHFSSFLTPGARGLGRKQEAAYWCPEDAPPGVSAQAPNPAKGSRSAASTFLPPLAPVPEKSLLLLPPSSLASLPALCPCLSLCGEAPSRAWGNSTLWTGHVCWHSERTIGPTAACLLGFQVGSKLPEQSLCIFVPCVAPLWVSDRVGIQ